MALTEQTHVRLPLVQVQRLSMEFAHHQSKLNLPRQQSQNCVLFEPNLPEIEPYYLLDNQNQTRY